MSIINNKQREKETAIFFNEWFNKTNGSNYVARVGSEDEEKNQKADYLLVQEGKNPIKLQITMCDHSTVQGILEANNNPGKVFSYNMELVKRIIQAIKDKYWYPQEIQETLTLLVWSAMANFDSEYLQNKFKENCPENQFREIYLIELPDTNSSTWDPHREGKVITLKNSDIS